MVYQDWGCVWLLIQYGRSSFSTLTLKQPSLEIIKKLIDMYIEEFGASRATKGFIASLPLMFITADEVLHMEKNGGNPLGLKVGDCPLLRKHLFLSFFFLFTPLGTL